MEGLHLSCAQQNAGTRNPSKPFLIHKVDSVYCAFVHRGERKMFLPITTAGSCFLLGWLLPLGRPVVKFVLPSTYKRKPLHQTHPLNDSFDGCESSWISPTYLQDQSFYLYLLKLCISRHDTLEIEMCGVSAFNFPWFKAQGMTLMLYQFWKKGKAYRDQCDPYGTLRSSVILAKKGKVVPTIWELPAYCLMGRPKGTRWQHFIWSPSEPGTCSDLCRKKGLFC